MFSTDSTIIRQGILFFSPAIFFQGIITTSTAVMQRRLRYDLSFLAAVAGALGTLGGLWVLQHMPSGMFVGIGSVLTGMFATALVSGITSVRLVRFRVRYDSKWFLRLLHSGFPLGITLMSNAVYAHVDTLILAGFRPQTEVGLYGLSYRVFETILVVPTYIMNAFYPVLLSAYGLGQKTSASFWSLIGTALRILVFAALLCGLVVWSGSPLLTIIRPEFAGSAQYLRVLAFSYPFFFITSLVMWILVIQKRTWQLVGIYVPALLLTIGANLVWVPQYGAQAAAWITVVSEGGILLALLYVLRNPQKK